MRDRLVEWAKKMMDDGHLPLTDPDTAPCSLCGRPSGIKNCGASWYLCCWCEGTDEAYYAGYTHHADPYGLEKPRNPRIGERI